MAAVATAVAHHQQVRPETLVDRACSDHISSPDWGTNVQLCDICSTSPTQVKDVLKAIKKKLHKSSPKVQILALTLLEALMKNCGRFVHQQVVERDVLHDIVKMAKKTHHRDVQDKILELVDSWAQGLGGPQGPHPQYWQAANELQNAGLHFPERQGTSAVTMFSPTPTVSSAAVGIPQTVAQPPRQMTSSASARFSSYRTSYIGASSGGGADSPQNPYPPSSAYLSSSRSFGRPSAGSPTLGGLATHQDPSHFPRSDGAGDVVGPPMLSMPEVSNARNSVEVLSEMLAAAPASDPRSLKRDEVVQQLLGECQKLQEQVQTTVAASSDEALLRAALSLNDDLQLVLGRYESLMAGKASSPPPAPSRPPAAASTSTSSSPPARSASTASSRPPPAPAAPNPRAAPQPAWDAFGSEPSGSSNSMALVPLGPTTSSGSVSSASGPPAASAASWGSPSQGGFLPPPPVWKRSGSTPSNSPPLQPLPPPVSAPAPARAISFGGSTAPPEQAHGTPPAPVAPVAAAAAAGPGAAGGTTFPQHFDPHAASALPNGFVALPTPSSSTPLSKSMDAAADDMSALTLYQQPQAQQQQQQGPLTGKAPEAVGEQQNKVDLQSLLMGPDPAQSAAPDAGGSTNPFLTGDWSEGAGAGGPAAGASLSLPALPAPAGAGAPAPAHPGPWPQAPSAAAAPGYGYHQGAHFAPGQALIPQQHSQLQQQQAGAFGPGPGQQAWPPPPSLSPHAPQQQALAVVPYAGPGAPPPPGNGFIQSGPPWPGVPGGQGQYPPPPGQPVAQGYGVGSPPYGGYPPAAAGAPQTYAGYSGALPPQGRQGQQFLALPAPPGQEALSAQQRHFQLHQQQQLQNLMQNPMYQQQQQQLQQQQLMLRPPQQPVAQPQLSASQSFGISGQPTGLNPMQLARNEDPVKTKSMFSDLVDVEASKKVLLSKGTAQSSSLSVLSGSGAPPTDNSAPRMGPPLRPKHP